MLRKDAFISDLTKTTPGDSFDDELIKKEIKINYEFDSKNSQFYQSNDPTNNEYEMKIINRVSDFIGTNKPYTEIFKDTLMFIK
jgi:hypothetical protein